MGYSLFYKDIKSHQSFTGTFEVKTGIKVHEKVVHSSALQCCRTPCNASVSEGDIVDYQYSVTNQGGTVVSGISVVDQALGPITLSRNALSPGDSDIGKASYRVT
jgi:hypothetical protein